MVLFKYLVICALLALTCQADSNYKDYDRYKTYEVYAHHQEQMEFLQKLKENPAYDFWLSTALLRRPNHIMVPPNQRKYFERYLEANGLTAIELVPNVGNLLPDEIQHRFSLLNVPIDGTISFTRYNRYETIQAYLKKIATDKPKLVTLINLGETYEDRAILGVKISSGGRNKRAILVDGGIHAREWMTTAMALYIIDQLVNSPNGAGMLCRVDWYVIPVLNPDGYEYTHTHDRFWKKNRNPHGGCFGTNLNRNFGFHWDQDRASSYKCFAEYAGPNPFSERETIAMKNFVKQIKSDVKLYLTFHSHGKYMLYPWGWTSSYPENQLELHSLAESACAAIRKVRDISYDIGSKKKLLRTGPGGSDDWMMGVAGVPLAYTIKLNAGGFYAFIVPPGEINGVVKETFEGIKIFADYIAQYKSNCV